MTVSAQTGRTSDSKRSGQRSATILTSGGAVHICNLYSITTNQAAIIALFRVVNRYVGNLAPMPGAFPQRYATRAFRGGGA
jgi:hypothetical protein